MAKNRHGEMARDWNVTEDDNSVCNVIIVDIGSRGGQDSTPVHSVLYEPIALLRVYRAKFESNQ